MRWGTRGSENGSLEAERRIIRMRLLNGRSQDMGIGDTTGSSLEVQSESTNCVPLCAQRATRIRSFPIIGPAQYTAGERSSKLKDP